MNNDNRVKYKSLELVKLSSWTCHLFGSSEGNGIRYTPERNKAPNFFVRYMMKICLGCKWVSPHPSNCCQECGDNIGWIGRVLYFHSCDDVDGGNYELD